MMNQNEYWRQVDVKLNELISDFKNRYRESIDTEFLREVRLGEIEKLWAYSDYRIGYNGNKAVYDGGQLRFAYDDLSVGKRDYDNPEHLELDAYLKFKKYLNGDSVDSVIVQSDETEQHPNIKTLIKRMDRALKDSDYSAVLHSSASIFETLAKDIVAIPSVQNQTLKAFFDRYRKDSKLPDELLNYIESVYASRNTEPLAGHGSAIVPQITKQQAIVISEMTIAFVNIEYKSRSDSP